MEAHELEADKVTQSSPESTPAPMAHQAVHDTVVRILQELPSGTLLDVPVGEGALALRLRERFAVHGCDLYPEISRLRDLEVKQGNLDQTLPYQGQSFDYVTCIEGLEHIENPRQAIREFARVLRPGGTLVVSVPNILNVEERMKWLLYGYTSHFKPITRDHVQQARQEFANREEVALHVNPIGYAELRYSLEEAGFAIQQIYRDKPKSKLWLYTPVTLLIRLVAALTPEKRKRELWTDELQSPEVLLGGNTLIVRAVLEPEVQIAR